MSEETISYRGGAPYASMTYGVAERVKNEYNNLRISSKDDLDAGISRYMDEVGNLIIDILCEYGKVDCEKSKDLIYKHIAIFLNAKIGNYGIVSGESGNLISPVIGMYHTMYFSAGFPENEYRFRMKKHAKAFKNQTEKLFKDIPEKKKIPVHDVTKEKEVEGKPSSKNNINKMVSRLKDLPTYINEVTVPLEYIEFDGEKMILKCSDLEAIKIADEIFEGINTEKDEDALFEDDYDEISKTLEEILEDLSRKDD